MQTMIDGYVTDKFGSRIGIAGEAVFKNNLISSVKNISSLNIRISHNVVDCSKNILNILFANCINSDIKAGRKFFPFINNTYFFIFSCISA